MAAAHNGRTVSCTCLTAAETPNPAGKTAIVVAYDDAGSGKMLAFQPYAWKSQGNAILHGLYSSLEALAERRARKQ